nr:endogenous retrovirus group K member 8 Gag polyprotein-like [Dasypus novemcinctus]
MLTKTVLSAAEFLQFKTWWTDEAAMRERLNRAQNPPVNITAEQLLGSGAWTGIERQLHYEDQAVNQVRQSYLAAWRRITAPGKPTQSFAKVIQGVNETYVEFIARLTDMFTKTIEIPEARELILLTLAFDQANSECKKAIPPIKATGGSVLDYIKACQDIGSTTHQMAVLASAMRGGNNPKKKGNCFKCGKFGHFQKNCRSYVNQAGKGPHTPSKICPVCHKGYHWANECRSKIDWKGTPLKSGNCFAGLAQGPQTKNMSLADQFPVSSGQYLSSQSQS